MIDAAHDYKSRVEERLLLSTLNFTILQSTNVVNAYPVAQLAKMEAPSIKELWNIYNPNIANSLIALGDLAEAGARVLTERETHEFAQYSLCSTLPNSWGHIGKKIEVLTPIFREGVNKDTNLLYGGKERGIFVGDQVDTDLRWLANQGELQPDITRDETERLVLF
ncbi:uncharacterized protein N7529_002598 [Penicillium soppii]|uniref:uncharacterized protein n=1 Tax=Penicillium soppii TaxID=69789 RepID=UPI0025473178|nr:uncharacterized protein N7529_002598 [Penicillium soppii]KAJ5874168.1 hypothetical protein N7529_002598 [Penicillium soppii]